MDPTSKSKSKTSETPALNWWPYFSILKDPKLCIYLLNMVSVIAFFSPINYHADLICQFRVQLAALSALMVFILACNYKNTKARRLLAATIIALILNAVSVIITTFDFAPRPPVESSAEKLSILQFNMLNYNKDPARLIALIKKLKPDLLCFEEFTPDWQSALKSGGIAGLYPYSIEQASPGSFGVAIYSKTTLQDSAVKYFGVNYTPSALATVSFAGKRLDVVATHPLPPVNFNWYNLRNDQFGEMAKFCSDARQKNISTVFCGDLNCSPWSWHFMHLLDRSGLTDSRSNFGVQPSWPTSCWVLSIPIDHVLVSRDLIVRTRRVEEDCGSDHYPIYVELSRK